MYRSEPTRYMYAVLVCTRVRSVWARSVDRPACLLVQSIQWLLWQSYPVDPGTAYCTIDT